MKLRKRKICPFHPVLLRAALRLEAKSYADAYLVLCSATERTERVIFLRIPLPQADQTEFLNVSNPLYRSGGVAWS